MRKCLIAIACLAMSHLPLAAAEPSADELKERRAALEARLGGQGFTVVVEPPFVVIGDESPATVKHHATGILHCSIFPQLRPRSRQPTMRTISVSRRPWQLAFLPENTLMPATITHNPAAVAPAGLAGEIRAKLRMIIDQGRAQVLSTPSVLVLDNRNAKIQVVQDVPVFKSVINTSTTNIDVSFQRVGIVLRRAA